MDQAAEEALAMVFSVSKISQYFVNNSFSKGGGGGGGLGNLGGNQQTGTVAIKYNPPKNKENILLVSVTTLNECRGKVLKGC